MIAAREYKSQENTRMAAAQQCGLPTGRRV
jgi:hypothetical protein